MFCALAGRGCEDRVNGLEKTCFHYTQHSAVTCCSVEETSNPGGFFPACPSLCQWPAVLAVSCLARSNLTEEIRKLCARIEVLHDARTHTQIMINVQNGWVKIIVTSFPSTTLFSVSDTTKETLERVAVFVLILYGVDLSIGRSITAFPRHPLKSHYHAMLSHLPESSLLPHSNGSTAQNGKSPNPKLSSFTHLTPQLPVILVLTLYIAQCCTSWPSRGISGLLLSCAAITVAL